MNPFKSHEHAIFIGGHIPGYALHQEGKSRTTFAVLIDSVIVRPIVRVTSFFSRLPL
jgi:hypothetical protein